MSGANLKGQAWGTEPMCVVYQEGKNLPFFDSQSGSRESTTRV